eukprot:CAMPEP_0196580658 /NCGR_PEP_ID=MMETSP1081-20130531/29869_1 /TAXON_ID=36882 /ORGANISM="Pyramimonas amylifera, Strain CCMP720" /LENGTH=422 /DNA_ID=CAMNT_0041900583 /DNA_START=132 /DNA_END=1400 /DNA_ORIENTATION=+
MGIRMRLPSLLGARQICYPSLSCMARSFSSAPSEATVNGHPVKVYNPEGVKRVIVTKELPGDRWLNILTSSGCRVEVSQHPDTILDVPTIKQLIGSKCDGVIGQLTEDWSDKLFGALKAAGGRAYSNYAVGYNNVNVADATKHGIPVGNTPGVLTETTAEIAAALTLSAARRVCEADVFMRSGQYKGWLPSLFVGKLLQNKTVGIIGAGRIGQAYAKMMVEGHKMNLIYYDLFPQPKFQEYMENYSKFCAANGEYPITVTAASSPEEVLKTADVLSLHMLLDDSTHHFINEERLNMMKEDALLVNAARGPVVDEVALVKHLKAHPEFRCGLDVFEDEPLMKPGLEECLNAVIVPHIASASLWTRSGMATLAASNVAAVLQGFPVCPQGVDVIPFLDLPLGSEALKACPSIVNAADLKLTMKK